MLNLNNNTEYKIDRTCKDCKNIDSFPLTKLEAAFDLFDHQKIWNTNCSKCGSKNCESTSRQDPQLNQELLDIWGNNLNLAFMDQDEELFLAELDYFPMLLKAIDEQAYLKRKIDILIESICVLLYDNTFQSEEYTDEENEQRQRIAEEVRPELIKRKDKIIKAEGYIRDYVKEFVFPQIGIASNTRY